MKRNKYGCFHRSSGPVIGPGRFNNAFAGRVSANASGYVNEKKFYRIMGRAPDKGLAEVPQSVQGRLEEAWYRYMWFMGIIDSEKPEETLKDKEQFAYLYRQSEGAPVVSLGRQAEFMHQVSGLPREMCVSWSYGNDVEGVAAGLISGDPDTSINDFYTEALAVTEDARAGRQLWKSSQAES